MPIMTYPGLKITGSNVHAMVTSAGLQYECIKALYDRYPDNAAITLTMDLSVEAEAFGCEVAWSEKEIPTVSKQIIESFDNITELQIPQVGAGRTTEYLKTASMASANFSLCPVFGGIIGPYSLAGRLYDFTEMMTSILIEPDNAHELLKKCTAFLIDYATAFKKAGCNGIIIAEPAAGLLAADQCEEFSSQYIKQIVKRLQDETFIVILHNCGFTELLVESMVGTGAAGLHFGNAVNMMNILPKVPSDIIVFGNVDPAGIIKNATPEKITEATTDLLSKTSEFRNFVISSGCDIPPDTAIENIDAFFEAVKCFNRDNY